MSNQIVISSGAKVRSLEGVLTGTAGIVNSVPLGGANGVATLDSNGKVPLSQLPASVVTYLGTWNAATNTPTLANGTGDVGDLYICNVAGTVNFGAGPITFAVGDWVIYNGSQWQKSAGSSGTVTSVAVSSTGNDAISITGSPITTSGTINIGFTGTSAQYVNGAGDLTTFPSLTGYVPYTGATQTVDLGAWDLNARGVKINGTGGLGHVDFKHQSGTPTGSASSSTLYADTNGNIAWLNDHLYTTTLISNANTADRSYTLPDYSGTVALLNGLQTFSGVKTFDAGLSLKNAAYPSPLTGYSSIGANPYGISIITNQSSTIYKSDLGFPDAQRTYTFPNADGTIALTSNLSSYVPYTGATGNVNLGTNEITASNFVAETSFSTKILASGVTFRNGYSTLSSIAGNFSITQAVSAGNLKSMTFDFSAWATNTSYTYTLPAASGTLALLSANQTFTGDNTFNGDAIFTSQYVKLDGAGSSMGNTINFKQFSSILSRGVGYSSIGAVGTTKMAFTFGNTTAFDGRNIYFDAVNVATGGSRTYSLPDASGTLALTSDLSNYVTLTTAQSISGSKTFGLNNLIVDGGILFKATAVPSSYTSGYVSAWFNINGTKNSLGLASSAISPYYYYYDFPNQSGTIALTSDLSSYVPYTGATGAVNLGTNAISASVVNANGNGSNAGQIFMKHGSGFSLTAGYASIGSDTSYNLYFYNTVSAATKGFILNAGSLTTGTTRTYTLPDASGTIALTSNIPTVSGTTNYHAKFTGTSTLGNSLIWDNGTNVGIGNTNTTYTFDVTGTGRFTGALTAASATFSSADLATDGLGNVNIFTTDAAATGKGGSLAFGGGTTGGTSPYAFAKIEGIYDGSAAYNGAMLFSTNNAGTIAERMRITTSGNVGIGTSSPVSLGASYTTLEIKGQSGLYGGAIQLTSADGTNKGRVYTANDTFWVGTSNSLPLGFITADTERMRITSGGYLKASNTGSYINATSSFHEFVNTATNENIIQYRSAGASPYGMDIAYSAASPNNTSNNFMYCADSTVARFKIASNGGVYNYSANNVNLSDISTKKDIILCESYWNKFKAIEIVKFKYIDQSHDEYNIGVIAQQVEEIAPEFIDTENWNKEDEEPRILKAVYTEDLHHATIKVLQEAMAKIEELEARLTALENKS